MIAQLLVSYSWNICAVDGNFIFMLIYALGFFGGGWGAGWGGGWGFTNAPHFIHFPTITTNLQERQTQAFVAAEGSQSGFFLFFFWFCFV